MAAYVIAEVNVSDPQTYERYKERAAPSLAPYGGRYLVRGGTAETLEGEWSGRLVILEFPSMAAARAWWTSDVYTEARAIRQRASRARFVAVEGV